MEKDVLEAKRLKILTKIKNIAIKPFLDEKNEVLQELEQEYNELMENLSRMHANPRFDPIYKLPRELCRTILYEVIVDRASLPFHEDVYDSSKALALTLVSPRWRDFILDMPLLWTDIQLDPLVPDCLARAATSLSLSQDMLINLHFTFPLDDWHLISPAVERSRHRIQSISLRWDPKCSRYSHRNVAGLFQSILKQMLPLPNLLRFFVLPESIGEIIAYWLQKECRSLHTMWGVRLRKEMIRLGSTIELRDASTSMDIDTLLSFQVGLRNLTRISFLNPCRSEGGATSFKQPTKPTPSTFPPFGWKEFHYHQSYPLSPAHIQGLTNVVTLHLTSRAISAGEILTSLHHLTKLKNLRCILEVSEKTPNTLPEDGMIIPNLYVKSLKLVLTVKGSGLLAPHREANRVQKCVIRALPALEDISLCMPGVAILPEFYNGESLLRVSHISIEEGTDISADESVVFSPSLQTITLSFLPYSSARFTSQTASRLDLNIPFQLRREVNLVAEQWPSLLSLSIRGLTLTKQDLSFKHLRKLQLKGPVDRWKDPLVASEDITRFCLQLATKPTNLPALESLSLHAIPQWDIYLLMLKRRNILWANMASPLKILGLLACYPSELTPSIVNLLQGKFPQSPSYYEVSMHSIMELLHDVSIPGCQSCLLCLRSCGKELIADAMGTDLSAEAWIIPPYPTSDDDILSTWEERYRFWKGRRLGRVPSCPIIRSCGMISITPESI
ncbi:hypothetical protein CPB86DRAFT_731575 [Serendipita vermifera]|nr:hypothetical protein CPB86DRAFT_731575 [Serendipita vermifera]